MMVQGMICETTLIDSQTPINFETKKKKLAVVSNLDALLHNTTR
jgi:hypothetical protein